MTPSLKPPGTFRAPGGWDKSYREGICRHS